MKQWAVVLLGLSVAAGLLGGCELCSDVDCNPGGGGGGGGGSFRFDEGLVFVRGEDIYAANAETRGFAAAEPLTSGGNFRQPAISPDGRDVAAVSRDGSSLVRISMNGGTPTTVLSGSTTFRGMGTPVFSPDGQRIFFTYAGGAGTAIGRVGVDGSGAVRLLGDGQTSYASPSFDRQGRLLVAHSEFNTALTALAFVDPSDGTVLRSFSVGSRVPNGVRNRAVLSPDGSKVAFDATTGSFSVRLYVVSSTGGTPAELNPAPGSHTFPAWVGNGQLAFASQDGGGDGVYVTSASSGGSAELVVGSGDEPTYGPN
jgi:Tol biopolymer transport system component